MEGLPRRAGRAAGVSRAALNLLINSGVTAMEDPKRMSELGLTDYALERYALAGDVGDWIERIGSLAEVGADKIWFSTERGDLERQIHYMRVFAEQIRPHFQ